MAQHKVAYIYSPDYARIADSLPANQGRSSLVHNLVKSFGLLDPPNVDVLKPMLAPPEELTRFHDQKFIGKVTDSSSNESEEDSGDDGQGPGDRNSPDPAAVFSRRLDQYGLQYDCPLFPDLAAYVQLVAGGSLVAALALLNGQYRYAIHWDGGRHHGRRSQAAGFCYVNDIVLAILALRRQFDQVLYIDVDVHHGDGVEAAFSHSDKVFTLSIHRYAAGFYPGTGACESVGKGRGKYFSLNVPLQDGLGDDSLERVFRSTLAQVTRVFKPNVIVLQCGSDGMAGDPNEEWNLTPRGLGAVVRLAMETPVPILFLGGGGYNHPNVARCNTYLTSIITSGSSLPVDVDIPDYDDLYHFSPTYDLDVAAGNMRDSNSPAYLESIETMVTQRLLHLV
ncbi:histone deacetylase 8 [Dimargaris cristalligena]|uniref:Histone deacetylase n=1 Tax=Dimargaris cristalligena TaxID=215637 RepID=A0A4P9ZJY6_9FUNG|nr:histone deacetylase 8 [Dimargaris cristalligena]|eukprot:RKP33537.1 histone deacetylase 8 [Dimargaris cristalligena]